MASLEGGGGGLGGVNIGCETLSFLRFFPPLLLDQGEAKDLSVESVCPWLELVNSPIANRKSNKYFLIPLACLTY